MQRQGSVAGSEKSNKQRSAQKIKHFVDDVLIAFLQLDLQVYLVVMLGCNKTENESYKTNPKIVLKGLRRIQFTKLHAFLYVSTHASPGFFLLPV